MCLSCNEMYSSKEELAAHQQEAQHTGEGMFDVHNVEPDGIVADDPDKVSRLSQHGNRANTLTVLDSRLTLNAAPVTQYFLSSQPSRVISSKIIFLVTFPPVICVGNPSHTLAQSFIIKRSVSVFYQQVKIVIVN